MAPKRPRDEEDAREPATKRLRRGFRVGPGNLPDGPWKRKVDKIKKNLIQKAKVKKAYQKIKAAEQASSRPDVVHPTEIDHDEPPSPQIHPDRQAMLDEEDREEGPVPSLPPSHSSTTDRPPRQRRQKQRRPGYFDKAVADAERKKAEAEARAQDLERRDAERRRKTEDRERFRRAMAKARAPGRDGQRKLGRESGLLLERVKKMMTDSK